MRISDWSSDVCSSDLRVMLYGATDVWRPKSVAHPGLPMMRSHINGARSFLDIGDSKGDLLAQVGGTADRLSALDVVEYPRCRESVDVDGEYIIVTLDTGVVWVGEPYSFVTASYVFEHFFYAGHAIANLLDFVMSRAHFVLQTLDPRTVPHP